MDKYNIKGDWSTYTVLIDRPVASSIIGGGGGGGADIHIFVFCYGPAYK